MSLSLLVTLLQGEATVKMTLQPLSQSGRVEKIYVVRDHPGPEVPKVKYRCLPKFLAKFGAVKSIAKLLLLLFLAAKEKPDVILSFQSFPHGVNAFICGKLFRRPVNVNIMGSPKIWRGRKKLIPMLKRCDIVTTTGSRSRQYLIDKGVDPTKVYVLPDSVDMVRFRPLTVPKKYDVIAVARLSSEKNIETLLHAVARAVQLKGDLRVGIAGDGPSRKSLEMLSDQLALKDNVEFLGFRNDTEYLYNSARVYVLSSISEGLPMAMLEAMACGIPCVMSDVGDITDAAIDGVNAILVDNPYNINAFAGAFIRLLEDDELRKTFSENALKVRGDYCYKRATEVWGNIFDSLNLHKKGWPNANTSSEDLFPRGRQKEDTGAD